MQQYRHSHKRTRDRETVQAKLQTPGSTAGYLQDNRPQSLQQQQVFQLKSVAKNGAVIQLGRTKNKAKKVLHRKTISGHGKIRRDKNKIKSFIVPKGKSVMRPAPPGATLGNLSMLLNEHKGLSRVKLVNRMKVSTTSDIWRNKTVIAIVKGNKNIKKTPTQLNSLDKLLNGKTLTGPEKGSLTKLEKKDDFEKWSRSYVKDETFKKFGEGEKMEDMELTAFESKLKSKTPHNENEYVKNKTILSQYVNKPGVDDCVVNACSWDEDSPYTGFQIDQN